MSSMMTSFCSRCFARNLPSTDTIASAIPNRGRFWRICQPCPLGCVVTDLEMPDIDGLELQSRLLEAGSSMPVIFYSGKGTVGHAVEGMRAGASTFLRKGNDIGELLDALEQAFAKLTASGY
ncbi:MAG TPA: response regulator [Allosphingosinicella sp.]|nr:response regulator [Allosphingosinicella sp.]